MARIERLNSSSHPGQKGWVARRSEVRRDQLPVQPQSIDMMVDPVIGQLKVDCAVVRDDRKPLDEQQAQGQGCEYCQERVDAKGP